MKDNKKSCLTSLHLLLQKSSMKGITEITSPFNKRLLYSKIYFVPLLITSLVLNGKEIYLVSSPSMK